MNPLRCTRFPHPGLVFGMGMSFGQNMLGTFLPSRKMTMVAFFFGRITANSFVRFQSPRISIHLQGSPVLIRFSQIRKYDTNTYELPLCRTDLSLTLNRYPPAYPICLSLGHNIVVTFLPSLKTSLIRANCHKKIRPPLIPTLYFHPPPRVLRSARGRLAGTCSSWRAPRSSNASVSPSSRPARRWTPPRPGYPIAPPPISFNGKYRYFFYSLASRCFFCKQIMSVIHFGVLPFLQIMVFLNLFLVSHLRVAYLCIA